jgi:23S rRNA (guanosine2251-2'-O)-methyltransferase
MLVGSLSREHPHAGEHGLHWQLEVLLDNLRSAWNVGTVFRIADGLGIRKLHLGGITPTPANPKVVKTALGAEQNVPWTYYSDGLAAAQSFAEHGYRLWALENHDRAISLLDGSLPEADGKVLLVVGNENTGIDPCILACCERMLCIPMLGVKRSLNVAVAFGIAAGLLRSRVIWGCEE